MRNKTKSTIPKCTLIGNVRLNNSLSSGLGEISITASLSNRLAEVAAAFEFYRFKQLRYRILCDSLSTSALVDLVAGYFPEEPNTTLTYEETTELTPCAHFASRPTTSAFAPQTVPSEWKSVQKSILLNTPVRWYRCDTASPEDGFIRQGSLLLASSNTSDSGNISIEFEYTVDFKGISVATA
jgi:hypothetical protein